MIAPIRLLTINEISHRKNDLLVSTEDIKKVARESRSKTIDELMELLKPYKYGRTDGVYIEIPIYILNEIAEQMKGGAE